MNCEFSLAHYQEIIETAKDKGYIITSAVNYFEETKKPLLIRHDVDFSLEYAYDLANYEYDLGIQTSYYIYFHSWSYNALGPEEMKMIQAMKEMGHEIGFHYDSRYSLSHEPDLLSSMIRGGLFSYTQHVPTLSKKETYQGLQDPFEYDLKYISDSGRNWREGCICQHIGKDKRLHVSIHPEWWVTNSKDRADMIHQLWMTLQNKTVRDCKNIKQMLYEYVRDDLKQGGEVIAK